MMMMLMMKKNHNTKCLKNFFSPLPTRTHRSLDSDCFSAPPEKQNKTKQNKKNKTGRVRSSCRFSQISKLPRNYKSPNSSRIQQNSAKI
jgi:hypothetical protein